MKAACSPYTSFSDIFPPPQFLEMPTVGLDISDKIIHFAGLKRHGSCFQLKMYGEEKIPEGIIEDGCIQDKEALTKILSNLRRAHGLHFVKVSLPEEESYIFRTTIPFVKETNIQTALQFKIEENVPLSLAESVYDYRILSGPQSGDPNITLNVTVVPRKVVSDYIDVLHNADLVPLALEIESQAIAHAALPSSADKTYIIIAIRETRTVLSIVSQGEVHFTSTLAIGGETVAASIKKSLNIDQDEVEKIRQGRELHDSNEIFLSLVSAATALRDEVQKLIAYWDGHSHEYGLTRAIEGIILSGSDAMLGIDDYLGRSLDMHVRIADPWVNILSVEVDVPALLFREALDYIPALGLALPYD